LQMEAKAPNCASVVSLHFIEWSLFFSSIVQGNKRTLKRFVGKEAIITTQCLNGWYELPLDIFNPQHF
jgi:hypothetical protein